MDKRTKNRLHEHTRDGHILMWDDRGEIAGLAIVDLFCRCSCGWFGWLAL